MVSPILALLACLAPPDASDGGDTALPPPGTGAPFVAPGLLLGAYSPSYLGTTAGVQRQLSDWDDTVDSRLTLGGVFLGVEDPDPTNDVPAVFRSLTEAGYTPFVNLASQRTMVELARGDLDEPLAVLAEAVADWASGHPDTLVFLAPVPEMNGDWETYGSDAEHYKQFFARLQGIFAAVGVPREAVRWVFAPNGWSPDGHGFEWYYPGDDLVDAVGFSAYQWGGCAEETSWDAPDEVYGPYIERMARMAPSKPLFVSQTAATSVGDAGVASPVRKGDFLADAYAYLAQQPQVLGVMYFNIDKECDWAVYREGVLAYGYDVAAASPGVTYFAPIELARRLR